VDFAKQGIERGQQQQCRHRCQRRHARRDVATGNEFGVESPKGNEDEKNGGNEKSAEESAHPKKNYPRIYANFREVF
jgi:hypothetical protein